MTHHWGYVAAVASAISYGLSHSLNKRLLGGLEPIYLAALIYTVSGLYLYCIALLPGRLGRRIYSALGLSYGLGGVAGNIPILLVVVLAGSLAAPYLYLEGLRLVEASEAALLSISELAFTFMLAAILLGERYRLGEVASAAMIVAGVALVTVEAAVGVGSSIGALLVLASCMLWALDNNLSTLLALRGDPVRMASLKSLAGGTLLLLLSAVLAGVEPLDVSQLAMVAVVGMVSMGNSLLFFFAALRHIGAGRTTAIFNSQSVFGALWAYVLLGEGASLEEAVATALIIAAILLMYRSGRGCGL
jgi:drug/metabolite transporter (DMT)-like permease